APRLKDQFVRDAIPTRETKRSRKSADSPKLDRKCYKNVMQLLGISGVLDNRMSAANLKIQWGQYNENGFLPISLDGQFSLRRIEVRPRAKRCPSCGSIIYSRRHNQ